VPVEQQGKHTSYLVYTTEDVNVPKSTNRE